MTQRTTDIEPRVVAALPVARALSRHLARESRRRCPRIAAGDAPRAASRSGRTASWCSPGRAPLPGEYGFLELPEPGPAARAAGRSGRAGPGRRRLRQETRITDPEMLAARRQRQHRPSPRQHAVRSVNLVVAEASSTAELLADIFAELGVGLTPEIAEALYIGARDGHGAVPVHEHDAEGAAARCRPRRGRRGRPEGVPGCLRDGAVRQAEAARPCARPRAGFEEGGGRLVSPAHATSPRSARSSRTRRASSTSPRRRGSRAGSADPRAARGGRPGAEGLAAVVHRRARRLCDRAEFGRRRPPAGRGVLAAISRSTRSRRFIVAGSPPATDAR